MGPRLPLSMRKSKCFTQFEEEKKKKAPMHLSQEKKYGIYLLGSKKSQFSSEGHENKILNLKNRLGFGKLQ